MVCKQEDLPVGQAVEFQLDAANKDFLDKFYKPDKDSDWYFRVFRTSDKRKSWVASDYASSGLQSVNTRTFGDAFIHPRNSDTWGWKADYVSVLEAHLKTKRIPAFDLGVWLFRDHAWPDHATPHDVLDKFFNEYSIDRTEREALFEDSLSSSLSTGNQLFQNMVVGWRELRSITGPPPDASPSERVPSYLEISIANVRSFAGRSVVAIKPLTLLVGENSSGKTTFMAALSAVCNPAFPMWSGLNESPYNLGSFDAIATFDGSGDKRAEIFSIGYRVKGNNREDSGSITAGYSNNRGQVELAHFEISSPAGHFQMSLDSEDPDKRERYKARIVRAGKTSKSLEAYVRKTDDYAKTDLTSFIVSNWEGLITPTSDKGRRRAEFVDLLVSISSIMIPRKTLSIAPIRTKPKRTYDETSDEFSPEGAHIPYVLARILAEEIPSKQKQILVRSLERYGRESGLFAGIEIRQLGDNISAPFQIMVDPSGVPTNLLDVGYGVSQALPIVVQSILLDAPQLLLLQQPEVHLHPRAQAALGSFFANLVAEGERQFVIETHSDFIVDRIRQEVATGRLMCDSVQILFFDKPGPRTIVHVLDLDSAGNILNAPSGYRNFFLREELNLISRTGGSD